MITMSKKAMKEVLTKLMDLGLTNPEIAKRLNTEYGATEDNALSTAQVAKLKEMVGLKGYKPKKKQLFELVDEDEPTTEELNNSMEEALDAGIEDYDMKEFDKTQVAEEDYLNSLEETVIPHYENTSKQL